jgi:hypothetical protein
LELVELRAAAEALTAQPVAILSFQQLHHLVAAAAVLITAQVVQAVLAVAVVELVQVVVAQLTKAAQAVSVLPTVPPIDPLAAAAVHPL